MNHSENCYNQENDYEVYLPAMLIILATVSPIAFFLSVSSLKWI